MMSAIPFPQILKRVRGDYLSRRRFIILKNVVRRRLFLWFPFQR